MASVVYLINTNTFLVEFSVKTIAYNVRNKIYDILFTHFNLFTRLVAPSGAK